MLITNFGKGGAQRVFFDHATAFGTSTSTVEEAVFNIAEDVRLYNSGLALHSLDTEKSHLPGPIGRLIRRAKALKSLVINGGFDFVVSHMDGANWVNVLSRSSAKKILVVHGTILHDYDQHPFKQWLRRKIIIPYLYNKGDITVAVSEGIAQELRSICKVRNVISIPNFFENEVIRTKALLEIPYEHQQLFLNGKILITSGRLADQKKQAALLGILKDVKKTHPEARLVMLGDGPLRETLFTEALNKGLRVYNVWDTSLTFNEGYDVYFLGYVENPYQYLSRSNIFLFPSAWEGFPMALCEAMIAGVPVLSADCPTGPREILAPGTFDLAYSITNAEYTSSGVLMPMVDKPGYQSIWVSCINELLNDRARLSKMAEQAKLTMTKYDKSVVLKRWTDILDVK